MTTLRRQHRGELKAHVVLEALRGARTINAIAADYGVHPLPIPPWKTRVLAGWPTLRSSRRGRTPTEAAALKAALDQPIGQ